MPNNPQIEHNSTFNQNNNEKDKLGVHTVLKKPKTQLKIYYSFKKHQILSKKQECSTQSM